MIGVSGVRNSCERIVRNSSFARFAASASVRAVVSRFVEPRILDGQSDSVSRELQKAHIVVAKVRRLQHTDVQHADRVTSHHEWNAKQRLNAFLAQQRIKNIRVVHVWNNQWSHVRQ